jgi:hypothetical protein
MKIAYSRRQWLPKLRALRVKCRQRQLTTTELDRGLGALRDDLRRILDRDSPAGRVLDREIRELPTEWREASTSPYVVPDDCKRIEARVSIIKKVLLELAPEIEAIEDEDILELPAAAQHDLAKAKGRLLEKDLSGAVAAACAAVDSATSSVYKSRGLGDPSDASFQEKVSVAIRSAGVIPKLDGELTALGWSVETAGRLRENLTGSINQAAYVMQTLRSHMSDVHGTQSVLEPLVYDSLKWAALIVRLLETK